MKTNTRTSLIPSTGRTPGPGLLDLLRSLTGLRDNPLKFLHEVTERYGELVQLKIGPWNAFVLSRPADIQHVLQDNHRNYTKDTVQYKALENVTGRGLLTNDGKSWLLQRRRIQPAFHRQKIQMFGPLMAEAAVRAVTGWQDACENGARIDLDREMMNLTLEILGKALLGVDLRIEAPDLTAAVLAALDHIVSQVKKPSLLPGFVPTAERSRFQQSMIRLDRAVDEIIMAHRNASNQPGGARNDLLTALLSAAEGEAPMSNGQARDEIITILIAGHETVASALTWCCYLLAQNPAVEGKLRQELKHVLNGRAPRIEDLPALEITRRVFDEALRLYPPAWLVTRKNIQEDFLSGVRIPPGSLVVISIADTHQNPAYWPNPQEFDPDRFLTEQSTARPRFAYLPFGGGPRLCIGNHFALAEAGLVLAAIYQGCHLEMEAGQEVIVDPLVTLRPRGGLPMRIVKMPA